MDKNVTEQDKDKTSEDVVTNASPHKHFKSFGMRVHRWGSYIAVDWFWNYVSGIAFACWGRYTGLGKALWATPVNKVATHISGKWLKMEGVALSKSVDNFTAFMSVIAGGTLFTIPPLMVLENKKNRRSMVKWLDEWHYGKDRVANDPRFEEAYDDIDHEAKKGFWSGQISRIVSLAPLLATVMLDTPRRFTRPYFHWVERGSEAVYNAVGLTKGKLYKKFSTVPSIKAEANNAHGHTMISPQDAEWEWLHQNSAIDFGLEPWYAYLHMATYGFFSSILDKKTPKHSSNEHKKTNENTTPEASAQHQPAIDSPRTQINHISREQHLANVAQVSQLGAS